MAKIVNYQIWKNQYIKVEVETNEEIVLVNELNKEMDKIIYKDDVYHSKTISADYLFDEYEYEVASTDKPILDVLIEEERNLIIRDAIKKLTKIQQHIIIEHFWNEKSLRQIAREKKQDIKSVRKSYHLAMKKLSSILNFLDE